jgi:hypothetical protein
MLVRARPHIAPTAAAALAADGHRLDQITDHCGVGHGVALGDLEVFRIRRSRAIAHRSGIVIAHGPAVKPAL